MGQPDLFGGQLPAIVEKEPLHERVERAWAFIHKQWPGIAGIRGLDDQRKRLIALRGRDAVKMGAASPEDGWKEVFQHISKSTFLRGLADPGRGRDRPFRMSLDFVLQASSFRKILDGVYDDASDDRDPGIDVATGRRNGPGGAAGNAAEARLRARFGEQRENG